MLFLSDIKKMMASKMVHFVIVVMLAVAIIDPVSILMQVTTHPEAYQFYGTNPYQFWLLMNSSGWGNQVYNVLFWFFPVLITGAVYYKEQSSSMYMYFAIRKNRYKYYFAKCLSAFSFSFCVVLLLLIVNLFITYALFSDNAPLTEQYMRLIPDKGTLAYELYKIHPFYVPLFFSIMNSLAVAILTVFTLAIQMLYHFPNQYIAITIPVIVIYTITFVFDAIPPLRGYDLRIIIQPRASCSMEHLVTLSDYVLTMTTWMAVTVILLVIGYWKRRDIL